MNCNQLNESQVSELIEGHLYSAHFFPLVTGSKGRCRRVGAGGQVQEGRCRQAAHPCSRGRLMKRVMRRTLDGVMMSTPCEVVTMRTPDGV